MYFARYHVIAALLFVFVAANLSPVLGADSPTGEFASTTIDLGVVTRDVEKSIKFYTEALGFTEVKGFHVTADYAKEVGLTDGHPLDIHVLVLGEAANATKLKLMSLKGVDSARQDQTFIHSTLGFSYLTIFVNDTNAALERLKKAGVKPIASTPKELPPDLPQGVYLTIVRDPDGNFVELVGPKK